MKNKQTESWESLMNAGGSAKSKKTKDRKPRVRGMGGTVIFPVLLIMCFCAQYSYAQTIPNGFWGINYWMPKKYINYPNEPNGVVNNPNVQTQIMDAGAIFYRIAGKGYDKKGTAIGQHDTTNDYIAAINAVKLVNDSAKFLIQVPFKSSLTDTTYMSPYKAYTLVHNIATAYPTIQFYYAIGNEWDSYRHSTKKYFASEMAAIIKEYAIQMKRADPNIRIVAPAVSYFAAVDSAGNSILSRLIGGAYDITQVITGSGYPALDSIKYYIDVVDYHTYAGGSNGDMSVLTSGNFSYYRKASIKYPIGGFATELSSLQSLLSSANTAHSRTGQNALTFAITEMNIDWKNPPLTGSASDSTENTAKGLGPRSFFASMYWLDMFSSILKSGTASGNCKAEGVFPWSVHEAGGHGTASDLGMTKDTAWSGHAPTPLPVYWAYQMMAKNFKGIYLPNKYTTNDSSYKAFAYKNTTANEIGVIVMNQRLQSPRGTDNSTDTLRIKFNNAAPTAASDMKFYFNGSASATSEYYCSITKETTSLLVFDTTGVLKRKEVYSLQDALRTIDTGPEVWGLGTSAPIATQDEFNSHHDAIYTDLLISPTSSGITESSGDSKVFRFTNTATVGGAGGDFEVPLGSEFTLLPVTTACP